MSSAAADHPERLVLDFDGTLWTRAALVDASERCAAGLATAGVSAGDVVCHFSLNDADVVITMLALVRLGAVECPVNAGLREAGRGVGLADLAAAPDGDEPRAGGRLGYHVLDVMLSLLEAAASGSTVDVASTCARPGAVPLRVATAPP